jgi:SAM-dependent methyltransferase
VSEGSVSFDRAAAYYDRTRVTDPEALAETLDAIEGEIAGRSTILEIGVGTGALAVPLAERGHDVVGMDLSTAMLGQLRQKSAALPVAAGDATRLPFADDTFGAAYARWVLHLIPAWRDVVAELARVVGPGGVVLIEPGGYRGDWREIWDRIESALGEDVRNVGLRVDDDEGRSLDEVFAAHGATVRLLPEITEVRSSVTLPDFLRESRSRVFSWTWRVEEEDLARGIDEVEAWAYARYGPDLTGIASTMRMAWRAYEMP